MELPKTLRDAVLFFDSFENCREFMVSLRWPDGKVKCPQCGSDNVSYLEKARLWKCYGGHERAKFSLKTGTIFEDSPIGLDKWLPAMWLVVNCKNGVSSYEISRDLGVTQKTAWFLAHRIRLALQHGGLGKLFGHVEVDESFIGGKARNMHKGRKIRMQKAGRNLGNKAIVLGMLQRGGKVRATVVEDREKATLEPIVKEHVRKGSHVYTDELVSYWGLDEDYAHEIINHAESYVEGLVHTNGLENFWSLLKRGLNGTYVCVEPYHLFRYIDEQAFRYNHRREMTDFDRFKLAASQAVGKRLTWEQLTGKTENPPQAEQVF